MIKNLLLVISLSFSVFIFSQNKPEPCDVVFGGKKEGLISLTILQKSKQLRFYNNKCKDEILGYTFYGNINGSVFMIERKLNIIPTDILSILSNYKKGSQVIFVIDVLSDNIKSKQNVLLKIK